MSAPPRADPVRLSKFMSLALRHDPAAAGLELDAEGWADLDALVEGCTRAGLRADRAAVEHVVATSDKRRFALSPDGTRIRANQGHSVPVDLALQPVAPPETLYHGTVEASAVAILRDGIKPMTRTHVHLSPISQPPAPWGQGMGHR